MDSMECKYETKHYFMENIEAPSDILGLKTELVGSVSSQSLNQIDQFLYGTKSAELTD